jgi:HEAT repeat protein
MSAAQQATVDDLVTALSGDDQEAWRDAWEAAPSVGAQAVVPVAGFLSADDPGVARAAQLCLEAIATRAGDPEAGEETRLAVSLALVDALDVDMPSPRRAQVLRYLSWVGGDEAIEPLGAWIADPDMGVHAIRALSRIPGAAARDALVALAGGEDEDLAAAAVDALGDRTEPGTEGSLIAIARASEGGVHVAALHALGRMGTPTCFELLAEVADDGNDVERWTAVDSALRIAQRLEATDPGLALEVYGTILASDVPDQITAAQHLAALSGIARVGSAEEVDTVLQGLTADDPIFMLTAMEFVVAQLGDDALPTLIEAAEVAPGPQRAAMTWMIAQLGEGDPVPFLIESLGDESPDVVAAAAMGLSARPDARAWDALGAVASDGPEDAQGAALAAILSILESLGDDAPGPPTESYAWVLEHTDQADLTNRALLGLARNPDPALLDTIEPYTREPATKAAALAAYGGMGLVLADLGEEAAAQEVLVETVRRGATREVASAAIQALRDMGVETDFAAEAGFITEWRVIGPFAPNLTEWNEALEAVLAADLAEPVVGLEWQRIDTPDVQGMVNLEAMMEPNQNAVAYAYAQIQSDAARDVLIKLGSDDGVVVWLNDERIHQNNTSRPVRVDDDTVTATLQPGANDLVLKILQGGGGWGYTVRITDTDGTALPLEVTTP